MIQYAIMICLDGKDDWIFVTEDTGKCDFILQPILFDDIEEAFVYAEKFVIEGKEKNIQVIEYES